MFKNKIIVLVEDNEQDEILTIRALKKNNILNDIVVLRDGQQAIDYFAKPDDDVDIQAILLDIKLPKLDGIEVLDFIRKQNHTKTVPVIVLTTSTEESDVIRSYSLGSNSYVKKPVNFDEFTSAVKQLGMYWLILNVPVSIQNKKPEPRVTT